MDDPMEGAVSRPGHATFTDLPKELKHTIITLAAYELCLDEKSKKPQAIGFWSPVRNFFGRFSGNNDAPVTLGSRA